MDTLQILINKFGGPVVPLTEVSGEYLGIGSRKALERASAQDLPIPVHRLGSQKSPWLVHLKDLAELIDRKSQEARTDWEEAHG